MLDTACLKPIGEYIALRRQRAAALVVQRPVMVACRETEAMRGIPPPPAPVLVGPGHQLYLAKEDAKCRATRILLVPSHGYYGM